MGPRLPHPAATVPLDAYPRHVRDRTIVYLGDSDDDPPIADLLAALPVSAELDAHDDCAGWHHTTPRSALVRALLYNHAHGWQNDCCLHRALRHDPYLLGRLGFNTVPDQSTLWRVQHNQFSSDLLATLEDATVDVVERTPVDAPDHCQLYVPNRTGPQVTPDDVQRILVPSSPMETTRTLNNETSYGRTSRRR